MKTIGKPLKNWAVEINNGIKTGFNDAFYIDEKKKHALINQDSRLINLIKPMLRGEDVGAFYPNFKDLYLINFHNGIKARNILPLRIEDYPVLSDTGMPIKLPVVPENPSQVYVNTKGKISVYDKLSNELQDAGYIRDLNIEDSCNGFVIVEYNKDVFEYKGYLSCDGYTSKGYKKY